MTKVGLAKAERFWTEVAFVSLDNIVAAFVLLQVTLRVGGKTAVLADEVWKEDSRNNFKYTVTSQKNLAKLI